MEFEAQFSYALHPMPSGRVAFRRWRWELWHGASLLATGWRTSPRQAEHALRAHAARGAHRLLGLHALRPEDNVTVDPFLPGTPVRLRAGTVSCLLVPRGDAAA
jgi:hypothetical protein